jgi:hypothetical protein
MKIPVKFDPMGNGEIKSKNPLTFYALEDSTIKLNIIRSTNNF